MSTTNSLTASSPALSGRISATNEEPVAGGRPSVGSVDMDQSPVDLLPTTWRLGNWGAGKTKLPHFLVKGRGRHFEDVARELLAAIEREKQPNVTVSVPRDATRSRGSCRTLRIEQTLGDDQDSPLVTAFVAKLKDSLRALGLMGHRTATDVTLQSLGNDLYVRFETVAGTAMTYLRWTAVAAIALLTYAWLGLSAFSKVAWAKEFQERTFYASYAREIGMEVERLSQFSMAAMLESEPLLFLKHFLPAMAGCAAFAVFLLRRRTSAWLRLPCRLLRWPMPDVFDNTVHAHNAWVERVLSDTLLAKFGVQEGQRFNIRSEG